jgi:hypothetical protein
VNPAFLCCPACGKEWDAHPGTVPMCEANRRLREQNERLRDIIRRATDQFATPATNAETVVSIYDILKEVEVKE